MRVLVTGGAGFIGSHVADAYLASGADVWVLDDLSSGRQGNIPRAAKFVQMDVGDPRVREVFREGRFDVVNHHAAQIDVRVSVNDPAKDARINLLGLLNLAEAAVEVGTKRFVYVSSGGVVYGEPEVRPTPEGTIKQPLSPYGVSKLAGEFYLNYYNRIRGLQYVALRYSNVYGPRQDPHGEAGVVAIFCERLLEGRSLTVFGDGEQTRDYVFVGDVVRANLAATEVSLEGLRSDGIDGVAFNVGTGVETSVNGLADLLEGIAGSARGREYREARPGELRNSSLDNGRLSRLGWKPATPLRDGLQQTYEHIARTRGG